MEVECIHLETLREEDIIPKEGGEGGVEPPHPGVPSTEMVVVYK